MAPFRSTRNPLGDAVHVNKTARMKSDATPGPAQRLWAHAGRVLGWLLLSRRYVGRATYEEVATRARGAREAGLRRDADAAARSRDEAAQRDFEDSLRSLRERGAAHLRIL